MKRGGKTALQQQFPRRGVRENTHPDPGGAQRLWKEPSWWRNTNAAEKPHFVWHMYPSSPAAYPKEFSRSLCEGYAV
jgi:hypothetical protein